MRRLIIPLFVPHLGCPHQCIFCNQQRISGTSDHMMTPDLLEKTVMLHQKTRGGKRRKNAQIAFFGGSFTGLETRIQKSLLSKAYDFVRDGTVESIRISTRPDYIHSDIVQFLKSYMVRTIELGVQSMVDSVLMLSNRGHSSFHVKRAVTMIKDHELEVGLQIMPGLPGDTNEHIMYTVDKIIEMKPDFVRIYPTLVIKDTPLEQIFLNEEYTPMTLNEAVDVCKEALLKFEDAHIPVARLGLQPTLELDKEGAVVAGPYHPAFRHLVESSFFFDMAEILIKNTSLYEGRFIFKVNPKDYSYFCGQKNENLLKLREKYGLKDVMVVPETSVKRRNLELSVGSSLFFYERKMWGRKEEENGFGNRREGTRH
ncbi:MAG: radical SAM protein [Thermodesulfobacteriota bacterium]|nr:radical SAM protein [Thermodesulfobacteriota bacterium]